MLIKRVSYFQSLLLFLVSLFFILFSAPANAGIVPCGGKTDPCTLCHLIVGIQNLIQWGTVIVVPLCVLCFIIAGIIYIVSTGSPQMIETAKKFMTSTLIGFTLTLCAWLIVNVTMYIISTKGDLGIEKSGCSEGGIACWTSFTCSTVSSTWSGPGGGGPGEEETPPPGPPGECNATGGNCGGLPGGPDCKYASSALDAKLGCLKSKGVGAQVISVTLNQHSDWCDKCVKSYAGSGYCAHSSTSCHYGGTKCKNPFESNAADLNASQAVAQAAVECGFDSVIWQSRELVSGRSASDHTSHVHVSVNNAKCGCDYKR